MEILTFLIVPLTFSFVSVYIATNQNEHLLFRIGILLICAILFGVLVAVVQHEQSLKDGKAMMPFFGLALFGSARVFIISLLLYPFFHKKMRRSQAFSEEKEKEKEWLKKNFSKKKSKNSRNNIFEGISMTLIYEFLRSLWHAAKRPFTKLIDWRELEAFFIYSCARQISKSPLPPVYEDFSMAVGNNVVAVLYELDRKMRREQSAIFFASIAFICMNEELQGRLRRIHSLVDSESINELQDEFEQIRSELYNHGYCFGPIQSTEQIIADIEKN